MIWLQAGYKGGHKRLHGGGRVRVQSRLQCGHPQGPRTREMVIDMQHDPRAVVFAVQTPYITMPLLAALRDSQTRKEREEGWAYLRPVGRLMPKSVRSPRTEGVDIQGKKDISGTSYPHKDTRSGARHNRYRCPHVTSCVPFCYPLVAKSWGCYSCGALISTWSSSQF